MRPVSRQILAAEKMAEFLIAKFASVIDVGFVSRHEVEKASKDLEARLELDLHTIPTIHFKSINSIKTHKNSLLQSPINRVSLTYQLIQSGQ